MNHKRVAVLVTLLAGAIFGCSDDDGPGQFRYPMAGGLEWHYTRTLTRVQDSASFVDYSNATTIRIGEKVEFGVHGEGREFTISENGQPFGAQYYQNRDHGLYMVGYCGYPPVVYPKLASLGAADSRIFEALEAADIYSTQDCIERPYGGHPDTPLALPYPIRTGQDWRYRIVEGLNWEIRKVNRGWSKVTVPAGSFDAYQIEWYYIGGPKVRILDDICAEGLLRRTLVIDSVLIRTPQHPGGTDNYETWIETLVLDSLKR
jgi:hypothetical protein